MQYNVALNLRRVFAVSSTPDLFYQQGKGSKNGEHSTGAN